MFKAVHQAYYQLRDLLDPAVEGSPYDRKQYASREKQRATFRYHMPKITKQFIVR